ncbi:MAG: preprotein translocase subunit SecG [Candidatus Komeilibacteria bacterium]|nr:preprotein translocase subunit SecG [Candidatus Komeilibacteria bacterium]
MTQLLNIIQITSAILMVIFILLQQRGAGLGGIFGGQGGVYRTKRGAEKIIFIITICLAVIFFASSLLSVFLSK